MDGVVSVAFLIVLCAAVIDLLSGDFGRAGTAATFLSILAIIVIRRCVLDGLDILKRRRELREHCPWMTKSEVRWSVREGSDLNMVSFAIDRERKIFLQEIYPDRDPTWYNKEAGRPHFDEVYPNWQDYLD